MKALYFAKPLEFRLDTPAESLLQGETFTGDFHAVNRGDAAIGALDLSVALAYAEFKQVKGDPAGAFALHERRELGSGVTLEPGAAFHAPWRFTLPLDCPITSKSGALFLLYGSPGAFGMLDLKVSLAPVLETFIATIENLFSFEATGRKYSQGFTEVRLKPPRSYPSLEKFQILMRYREPQGMELVYQARVKGFDREGKAGLKSRHLSLERTLPPEQALPGGKLPNRALFRQTFAETLAEIVPTFLQKR
jgi:hypothetical protein